MMVAFFYENFKDQVNHHPWILVKEIKQIFNIKIIRKYIKKKL